MMELLFLLSWTGIFLLSGWMIWRRIASRRKTLLMMLLNFVYLSGIFSLYPVVLEVFVRG